MSLRFFDFMEILNYNINRRNCRRIKMLDEKFWAKYFKVYDVLNLCIPYQELMAELEKELDLNSKGD